MSRYEGRRKSHRNTQFFLTARSILALCWGLTLNFSHEQQQIDLGRTYTKILMQMLPDMKKNLADREFLENLLMVMSGTLRSLGFIRENHVLYLDFQADRLTRKRQSLEQIGDLASFSGSGLYSKIGSFIGFGSVAQLVQKFNLPQLYIPLFAAAGVAGAVLLTILIGVYISSTEDSWNSDIKLQQNHYWKTTFKPDVTRQLLSLSNQIKVLIREYYPNANEIIGQDELLKMTDDRVNRIISDEILPPDHLIWPPYTIAETESTATNGTKSLAKNKASRDTEARAFHFIGKLPGRSKGDAAEESGV